MDSSVFFLLVEPHRLGQARPVESRERGVARQPETQSRLFTIMFLTVGLVEAAYFINLAFAALFIFSLANQ